MISFNRSLRHSEEHAWKESKQDEESLLDEICPFTQKDTCKQSSLQLTNADQPWTIGRNAKDVCKIRMRSKCSGFSQGSPTAQLCCHLWRTRFITACGVESSTLWARSSLYIWLTLELFPSSPPRPHYAKLICLWRKTCRLNAHSTEIISDVSSPFTLWSRRLSSIQQRVYLQWAKNMLQLIWKYS